MKRRSSDLYLARWTMLTALVPVGLAILSLTAWLSSVADKANAAAADHDSVTQLKVLVPRIEESQKRFEAVLNRLEQRFPVDPADKRAAR